MAGRLPDRRRSGQGGSDRAGGGARHHRRAHPGTGGGVAPSTARPGVGGKRRSAPADPPPSSGRTGRMHRPPGRSAGDLAYENDRLKARLAAAEQAHQRERTRRRPPTARSRRNEPKRCGCGPRWGERRPRSTSRRPRSASCPRPWPSSRRRAPKPARAGNDFRALKPRPRTAASASGAPAKADDVARQLHDARAAAQHAERSLSGVSAP